MVTTRLLNTAWLATALLAGAAEAQAAPPLLPMLHTEGTRWLAADGSAPALRGVNLATT